MEQLPESWIVKWANREIFNIMYEWHKKNTRNDFLYVKDAYSGKGGINGIYRASESILEKNIVEISIEDFKRLVLKENINIIPLIFN